MVSLSRRAAVVLVLVALTAPGAVAQVHDAPRDEVGVPRGGELVDVHEQILNVTAHDGAGDFRFEVEGLQERNPLVTLTPGARVTVHVTNEGNTWHNIRFGGPVNAWSTLLRPGASDTVTFLVPEDADTSSGYAFYWCDPHRALGMIGSTAVARPANAGDAEETLPAGSGATVALAFAVVALTGVLVLVARARGGPRTR